MEKKIIAMVVTVSGLLLTFIVILIVLMTKGVNSNQEATTSSGDVMLKTDNSTNYSLFSWHTESAIGAVIVALIILSLLNVAYNRLKSCWKARTTATVPIQPLVVTAPPPTCPSPALTPTPPTTARPAPYIPEATAP